MLFNSFVYCLFLPLVLGLYYIFPVRLRWILLFLASSYFYMCFIPVYILILFALIGIDYCFAIAIENSTQPLVKKKLLIISILCTCATLFVFKYFDFFASNLNVVFNFLGLSTNITYLKLILPFGLSFHTFQGISYVIEVYKGRQRAERHLGIYANYIMFFPQLVAGPIEKPQHLLPQLNQPSKFEWINIQEGIPVVIWGFFKKIVIADRLGLYVDKIFDRPSSFSNFEIICAIILFAFQVYCDFSGYSDIARGSARFFGIDLVKNFLSPFLSFSLTEFWQRFHISLTVWFRDYIYFPLGGSRTSSFKAKLNVMIVFGLSGLWHGANWTFLFCGLTSGVIVVFERVMLKTSLFHKAYSWLSETAAFPIVARLYVLFAYCLGLVFFRSKTLTGALEIYKNLLSHDFFYSKSIIDGHLLGTCFGLVLFLYVAEVFLSKWDEYEYRIPLFGRLCTLYTFLFMMIFFNIQKVENFIYFQF